MNLGAMRFVVARNEAGTFAVIWDDWPVAENVEWDKREVVYGEEHF